MDLIDTLQQLGNRISKLAETVQTEEATKNALIMPLIQALGYNVFDPFEVVPEFTCDVGTKKNEKVDYAIMRDGEPAILVECKCMGSALNLNHASQLYRYFGVTSARFAILTNGVDYMFYTDIEAPNKMDDKPFFEFSMTGLDPKVVGELKKFSKSNFDLNNILSNASELKYKKQIRSCLSRELENPSDEFVRLFAKKVYPGTLTAEKKEQFSGLVAEAFREWVNNRINERLQSAMEAGGGTVAVESSKTPTEEESANIQNEEGIVTTEEELESFRIVRAILAELVDPARVFLKDTKSYCGILLDHNVRKPLCRLIYTSAQSTLILLDKDRKEERFPLESPVSLYQYADKLKEYAKMYLEG